MRRAARKSSQKQRDGKKVGGGLGAWLANLVHICTILSRFALFGVFAGLRMDDTAKLGDTNCMSEREGA